MRKLALIVMALSLFGCAEESDEETVGGSADALVAAPTGKWVGALEWADPSPCPLGGPDACDATLEIEFFATHGAHSAFGEWRYPNYSDDVYTSTSIREEPTSPKARDQVYVEQPLLDPSSGRITIGPYWFGSRSIRWEPIDASLPYDLRGSISPVPQLP